MLKKQQPRPFCTQCKNALAKSNGESKQGFKKWHKYCTSCARILYNPRYKHLQHKKLVCESCGFKAKDQCQLDLVYIDRNKKNKKLGNIKTVCANCSRLHKKMSKILEITVDSEVRIG